MTEKDLTLDRYYSLVPRNFPVLVRLEILQTIPPEMLLGAISIHIELRPSEEEDRRRLFLSFQGVVNLQIKQEWSEFAFSEIKVVSIQDHQWEQLNYKVYDEDEESISFFCRSFEASIKEV